MKLGKLLSFSKGMIKGRRAAVTVICLLPILSELLFRSSEAAIYSLLLYFGKMKPLALFSGRNRIQLAAGLVLAVFRTAVSAPLSYGAACWLTGLCSEKRAPSFTRILMSRRCFRRALGLSLASKFAGLAAVIPAAFFGKTAYVLFGRADTAGGLFMACHAAALTAFAASLWLSLKISLCAAPYLAAQFPEKSVFRIILYSISFMRGKKHELVCLVLIYLPAMLTVVGIPYAAARIKTAFSLGISIHIKEEEYFEGTKTESDGRKRNDARKIPHGKTRCLKKAPHKAETA